MGHSTALDSARRRIRRLLNRLLTRDPDSVRLLPQLAGKKAAGAVLGESEKTKSDRKKTRAKRKRAYANK
eukprot:8564033-Pyramimonas_sp.AAC.1